MHQAEGLGLALIVRHHVLASVAGLLTHTVAHHGGLLGRLHHSERSVPCSGPTRVSALTPRNGCGWGIMDAACIYAGKLQSWRLVEVPRSWVSERFTGAADGEALALVRWCNGGRAIAGGRGWTRRNRVTWRRLRYASAPKDESCKRHVVREPVGRGGYMLLGCEAHAGVREEVWKLLEVLGGVAEFARECCVRSGGRIWFYTPPLSRTEDGSARTGCPCGGGGAACRTSSTARGAGSFSGTARVGWPTASASLQSSAQSPSHQSLTVSPIASPLLLSLAHCAPLPPHRTIRCHRRPNVDARW